MRQPVLFIFVGGFQYLLDTVMFGVFVTLGLGTFPSNITSRASAAAAGFLLNRYMTFSNRNDTVQRFSASLIRFLLLFAIMTTLSTGLILLLERLAGDSDAQRIIYKFGVEGVLAVLSFFLSRNWVYRN
jgi:putative flippase GtrA